MRIRHPLVLSVLWFLIVSTQPVAADEAYNSAESWYTYWGLGFSQISFGGEADEHIERLENSSGESPALSLSADLLGFYWPAHTDSTLSGVVIHDNNAIYTGGNLEDDHLASGTMLGFSHMHFFGRNPGDGWFVRGDIGPSTVDYFEGDSELTKGTGVGYLVGFGYGKVVSSESRMLTSVLISKMGGGESDATAFSFVIGGLW